MSITAIVTGNLIADPDRRHADSATALQHQLLQVAREMVELIRVLMRATLVTFVDGAPVVLTELTSGPIPRRPDDEGGA